MLVLSQSTGVNSGKLSTENHPTNSSEHSSEIPPPAQDDGDAYFISFPDYAECISEGETVEDAIASGRDALKATLAVGVSLNTLVLTFIAQGMGSSTASARTKHTTP